LIASYLGYMVLSALSFAGLDLVRKLLAGRIDSLALVFFMSLGAMPLLATLVYINGIGPLSGGYVLPALGALILNFLASLAFIHSVKISPLSRTVPLLTLTPAFTALTAIPLLGEIPTRWQSAGILLVVAGAMALNAGGAIGGVLRGVLNEKGAALMVLVALMWAVSGPLDKRAIAHASVYFHATLMTCGVGTGALGVLAWRGRLGVLGGARRETKLLVAAAIAISLALTFQLLAIRCVQVSLVEAFKRAVGSFMAVVLGRIVFGEKVRSTEWVAVAVMVAGVFLLLG
jgi:drug/metabolite transporter (DMT)-like permease